MINIFLTISYLHPILVKKVLSPAMKFCLCKFKYNHQVSYFDINYKTKLVETFVTLQKLFTWAEKVVVLQIINPIQHGLFRGCSRMGAWGGFWPPFPKIRHTYPTIMKLGIVIPYVRKIQKIFKSRDTCLDFCWHQHFSSEISNFCYIKKCSYRLDFDT